MTISGSGLIKTASCTYTLLDLVTQVYSPVSFGKKYKAEQYIRRFVPELKDVPDKFIYEPHKMTMEKQKAANCIIGKVPLE